jgi:hypothetical protein
MPHTSFLPHAVTHLPWHFAFGLDGKLLPRIHHYVKEGVVRVIAGATECHLIIDVRRPYLHPNQTLEYFYANH